MTATEAHAIVRRLRQPPFDDADTDYDFVRLWERRHCFFAALFVVFAAIIPFLGTGTGSVAINELLPLGLAIDQVWRCRRFRQIRRLFEDRAPQGFRELEQAETGSSSTDVQ